MLLNYLFLISTPLLEFDFIVTQQFLPTYHQEQRLHLRYCLKQSLELRYATLAMKLALRLHARYVNASNPLPVEKEILVGCLFQCQR